MEVGLKDQIIAIVSNDSNSFYAGAVPVFFAEDEKKKEELALLLAKITNSMAHRINGIYLIVKH